MSATQRLSTLLMIFLLTACANIPTGPSVMALPGSGKNFDQFRSDDYQCKQYAHEQIGGTTAQQASRTSGIESAAVGAGLGAAAGALIGGGEGAAIGAGTGLLVGGLAGTDTARTSGYASQKHFDIAYIQCMYAKGHRVPVLGKFTNDTPRHSNSSRNTLVSPRDFTPPPPPPGNPPPPPPK